MKFHRYKRTYWNVHQSLVVATGAAYGCMHQKLFKLLESYTISTLLNYYSKQMTQCLDSHKDNNVLIK